MVLIVVHFIIGNMCTDVVHFIIGNMCTDVVHFIIGNMCTDVVRFIIGNMCTDVVHFIIGNMCTDVVRFINDGPATMTCTMNRTKTFDEIQIIKIKDSEMTNISKIDNNGNIQYLSSANIEITSAQKYEIDLKFQNISCADEGHYILVIIKELKMIATVSGTLTPQSEY